MPNIPIKFKRLQSEVVPLSYSHPGDAGLNVFSLEDYILRPGERHVFNLGFALEFEEGYGAFMKDRSSMSRNAGVHVMGGVFDAGYRGEYNVLLVNLGNEAYKIEKGHKIAQLVILPIGIGEFEEVEELSESSRGRGGFGSTGK
jgi:dUTP pyrophosphatase